MDWSTILTYTFAVQVMAAGIRLATPLVFTSLGIPSGAAIVITLAFRGLSLWLPLVPGFLLLRWIRASGLEPQPHK